MDDTLSKTGGTGRGGGAAARVRASGWVLGGLIVVWFGLFPAACLLIGLPPAFAWWVFLAAGAGMIWHGTRRLRVLGGAVSPASDAPAEPGSRCKRTFIPDLGCGFMLQGALFLLVCMLTVYGDSVRSCSISFGLWDVGLMALCVIGYRPTRFDRKAVLLGPVLFSIIAVCVELGCHVGD